MTKLIYYKSYADEASLPAVKDNGEEGSNLESFFEETRQTNKRIVNMGSHWGMPLHGDVWDREVMENYQNIDNVDYLARELALIIQIREEVLGANPDAAYAVYHKLSPTQPEFTKFFDREMKERGYSRFELIVNPKAKESIAERKEDRTLSTGELTDLFSRNTAA